MKNKVYNIINDNFVLITSILSVLISILYLYKGITEVFTFGSYFIIIANFLYIPLILIFNRKCFVPLYLIYAFFLIFVIAFNKTYLHNNYTALFLICIVIMINPKSIKIALSIYFLGASAAFMLNEENLINFLIHMTRSVWFIVIIYYVINNKFNRKTLILYEDEMKILDQMCNGKVYQKEVQGFSENTIYRKLKAARERNGNLTREELINLYKSEYKSQKESSNS